MTQAAMAQRLGITIRTVQKYEQGHPMPESMRKLISYEFEQVDTSPTGEKYSPKSLHSNPYQLLQELAAATDPQVRTRLAKELTTYIRHLELASEMHQNKYIDALEKLNELKDSVIDVMKLKM